MCCVTLLRYAITLRYYIVLLRYVITLRSYVTLRYAITLFFYALTLRYVDARTHSPTHPFAHAPTAIARAIHKLNTR